MKESEFNEAVAKTRLSKNNREAARRVLVDGERHVDVCAATGVLSSVLARATGVLEREAAKIREQAAKDHGMVVSGIEASRAVAVKEIRDLLGEQILVRNAPENGLCSGKVLVKTEYHVVQDLLKGQVMVHELAKLDRVPKIGGVSQIRYEGGFGRTLVQSKTKELDKGREN